MYSKSIKINYTKTIQINATVEKVFAFCASPDDFEKHFPHPIHWINTEKEWKNGSIIEFKFRFSPIWLYWKAEIIEYQQNKLFIDILRSKFPYKYFRHSHLFESQGEQTIYTDKIEFSLGFGNLIDKVVGIPVLESTFNQRHINIKNYFNPI
ncbi:MAG: hypothetical protein AAGM40_03485 [Cyanobacteria bacterium J06573_2]